MKATFLHNHLLSADQFTKDDLSLILATAAKMEKLVATSGGSDVLRGKIMTALFYEPSSRTFGSFVAAMQRLGGGFIPLQGVTYSSVAKGESLPDSVRTFASFSDVIVIRHPEVGAAKIASEFSAKPIINAGDGVGEHPTQALLDLYTIQKRLGGIDGITVTMVGDLLNGRTIHSLTKLLSMYKRVKLQFVAPEILQLPASFLADLKKRAIDVKMAEALDPFIGSTDVLYVTRVQKERFTDLTMYEKLKHHYIVTPDVVGSMKQKAIIMHPFPRVGEITMDVDMDARAAYITDQIPNGMYVRMAVLSLMLG